jgi:hypothetical protein
MAEEKPDQPQENAGRGNKKINKLTLAEVEKQLQEIKISQGGHTSRYAKVLQRRKNNLLSPKS